MSEQVCECSEDYGPCEDHCEVLAQREGASTRTADELAYVFLCDAEAILRDSNNVVEADKVRAIIDALPDWEGWLKDADDAQALHDDVSMVESWLSDAVYWEDGYRIVRMSADCPLLTD